MDGVVARLAAELVSRCRELTRQVNALERELGALVRELAPALLEVPTGCGTRDRQIETSGWPFGPGGARFTRSMLSV